MKNIPPDVLILIMKGSMGIPVDSEFYENCLKKYPEYFKEEIQQRKNWESVPKIVHDQYRFDVEQLLKRDEYKIPDNGKGIMYWMENLSEFSEHLNRVHIIKESINKEKKKIHLKHYSKYKVKFISWI